jgi:hypothetical protein
VIVWVGENEKYGSDLEREREKERERERVCERERERERERENAEMTSCHIISVNHCHNAK